LIEKVKDAYQKRTKKLEEINKEMRTYHIKENDT